jgi:hypothetical protein
MNHILGCPESQGQSLIVHSAVEYDLVSTLLRSFDSVLISDIGL